MDKDLFEFSHEGNQYILILEEFYFYVVHKSKKIQNSLYTIAKIIHLT